MPRPKDISDEEWEDILERKATEKAENALFARIEREGFEMEGFDPLPGDTCCVRDMKKRGRKTVYEPCGNRPVVVLRMRSPDNPEGLRVPMCRDCLAGQAKEMISLMQWFV